MTDFCRISGLECRNRANAHWLFGLLPFSHPHSVKRVVDLVVAFICFSWVYLNYTRSPNRSPPFPSSWLLSVCVLLSYSSLRFAHKRILNGTAHQKNTHTQTFSLWLFDRIRWHWCGCVLNCCASLRHIFAVTSILSLLVPCVFGYFHAIEKPILKTPSKSFGVSSARVIFNIWVSVVCNLFSAI